MGLLLRNPLQSPLGGSIWRSDGRVLCGEFIRVVCLGVCLHSYLVELVEGSVWSSIEKSVGRFVI